MRPCCPSCAEFNGNGCPLGSAFCSDEVRTFYGWPWAEDTPLESTIDVQPPLKRLHQAFRRGDLKASFYLAERTGSTAFGILSVAGVPHWDYVDLEDWREAGAIRTEGWVPRTVSLAISMQPTWQEAGLEIIDAGVGR